MIHEIIIKDFVLIEEAAIDFGPGFTAITGETGAGKSLLIQALKLLCGERGGPQFVREGCRQAVLQMRAEPSEEAEAIMEELGIEAGDELVARRIITDSGKSRVYVNGAMVTLADLRRIVGSMISIAGQHEYHSLLRPERQRMLLDAFSGLSQETGELAVLFDEYRKKERRLRDLRKQKKRWEERRKELEAEVEEITKVAPEPGEEDELRRQREVLKSASSLRQLGEQCYHSLYGGAGSVEEILAECGKLLGKMAAMDPSLDRLARELDSVALQASELASDLRSYLDSISADPARLEEIENRLYALRSLMRKFGPEIEDVLRHKAEIEERLKEGAGLGEELERLEEEVERQGRELVEKALYISHRRAEAAERLGEVVTKELKGLKMKDALFSVEVKRPEAPLPSDVSSHGLDEVTFFFRPNAGSSPRPLADIASGGELSRLLLTIRSVIAVKEAGTTVMVFDEIDAGIGGEVASRVGEKLCALASQGQVLAVTHFPQIAAVANGHILVSKATRNGSTVTSVSMLDGSEERHAELTRMLGGKEGAAGFARELMEWRK